MKHNLVQRELSTDVYLINPLKSIKLQCNNCLNNRNVNDYDLEYLEDRPYLFCRKCHMKYGVSGYIDESDLHVEIITHKAIETERIYIEGATKAFCFAGEGLIITPDSYYGLREGYTVSIGKGPIILKKRPNQILKVHIY